MKNDSMELYGNIMKTDNYDMFKLVNGNRRINKTNYSKLIKSMKEEQLIIPILVNEKYEIIDGQHRYTACKDLGISIYFYMVRGYGISQVKRANISSSNWTKENYLDMFIAEKVEIYIKFDKIKERYDLSISNLLKIFAIMQGKQMSRLGHEFIDGRLKLDEEMQVLNFLSNLEDFNFFKGYKDTNFIMAFIRLYFRQEYDHLKMKKKLSNYGGTLIKKTTIDEYLSLICNNIYSYGSNKDPINYSPESQKFHQ